ncbi:MAG: NAD(P)/FAD-dependent oxidoreductase [Pseudomonadales bacterium]
MASREPDVLLDALVIGGGFNGVYQLYRLRQQGFVVQLFEAGSALGGVWHHNRYPGARVDSHVPDYAFSLEPLWRNWTWSERFPGREELQRYFAHVDSVLNLSSHVRFNTRVVAATFEPGENRWRVESADGHTVYTRFLIPCLGFASRAYTPALPGHQAFKGRSHHTAHWPTEGVDFAGQRVGVIGTGASGVQVVQEAAPAAEQLVVFQRTPVFALAMQQQHWDPETRQRLKSGYADAYRRRGQSTTSFSDVKADPRRAVDVPEPERSAIFEAAWQRGGFHFWAGTFRDILSSPASNRLAYDFWRSKVLARIQDPGIAAKLAPVEPPYPFGAKRPSLEQTYYDVFNQPNVQLVDLKETPLVELNATGVRTQTGQYDLDVLVLATGFDASTGGFDAIDFRGLGGRTLRTAWSTGVTTYLGMAVPGFPNLLMLYGPHSPTAFCNGPTCAELQGEWVVRCLEMLRARGATRIDASDTAAAAWKEHMDAEFADSLLHKADSWYMAANVPGKPRQLLFYPNTQKYLAQCSQCADNGYQGFVIR